MANDSTVLPRGAGTRCKQDFFLNPELYPTVQFEDSQTCSSELQACAQRKQRSENEKVLGDGQKKHECEEQKGTIGRA